MACSSVSRSWRRARQPSSRSSLLTRRLRSGCTGPGPALQVKAEPLHEAFTDPGLRDDALDILRGLIERVVVHPGDAGPQIELVGEIVRMVELGLNAKQAALPGEAACSVKVVAGAGFEPATFRL
jgi:hypothetical protein